MIFKVGKNWQNLLNFGRTWQSWQIVENKGKMRNHKKLKQATYDKRLLVGGHGLKLTKEMKILKLGSSFTKYGKCLSRVHIG